MLTPASGEIEVTVTAGVAHTVQALDTSAPPTTKTAAVRQRLVDDARRSTMSIDDDVKLDDERLARIRRHRQLAEDNLLAIREILHQELGMRSSHSDRDVQVTLRIARSDEGGLDPCIEILDPAGCAAYCDPPGICRPCSS